MRKRDARDGSSCCPAGALVTSPSSYKLRLVPAISPDLNSGYDTFQQLKHRIHRCNNRELSPYSVLESSTQDFRSYSVFAGTELD